MKTSHSAARPAALILAAAALASSSTVLAAPGNGNGNAYGKTDPLIPVGMLSAFPMVVQTGTHPNLTWEIQYPETAQDILVAENDDVCMQVRVLGGSYQIGVDAAKKPIYGYLQANVFVDGVDDWTTFFSDTQTAVSPTWVYAKSGIYPNRPVKFQARGYDGNAWTPLQTSGSSSGTVLTLYNGSALPQSIPAFQQGLIEQFLKPYVDAGGNVRIGPKDMLVLFELDQTNASAPGFDLQDLVLLVTYDYCKNNNGHGNNFDGVDVSNPGQGGGGPTGSTDPSGTYDDEMR